MENIKLFIIKSRGGTNFFIHDYITSLKISCSFSQISTECSFSLPYATYSDNLLPVSISVGDYVKLYYKDNELFNGKVTDTTLKGKDQELSVTCYDITWWICKCNITKNFNNISIAEAIDYIYTQIGIQYYTGDLGGENGKIIIKNHLVKNKPASKVLYAICSEATKIKQGVYYYLHMLGDGLMVTITEADKYYSGLTIQPAWDNANGKIEGNLIDYQLTSSMQDMITRVYFYKTDGSLVDTLGEGGNICLDNNSMLTYGTIAENVEVDDDDSTGQKALAEGNKLLNEKGIPKIELNVTCFGDLNYLVAHGVMVKIPNTDYYNKFMYITSSEWTWNKDGTWISKLGLSPSKNQNITDWEGIEESPDKTDEIKTGSSSDLANRILTELKSHLGLPYKWSGKSPANGGMDCSGYIAYCYNQFKDELEIKSNNGELTSYTVTMMEEGKDVTSDFPDNLKPCDIIFPHSQHVIAYIGDGQTIEEPQTGDVCKVAPLRKKVLKVIRVIPDSAWQTSSSGGEDSNGKYSSKLVEFTESWEGYRDSVYDDGGGTSTIGYGTTAQAEGGHGASAIAKGTCTKDEAEGWLKEEMDALSTHIQDACTSKGATLNQCAFDCLLDICYQWGYPRILTQDKHNIFSSLCSGDTSSAKSGISTLGYKRRDNARCDLLDGNYTLNS